MNSPNPIKPTRERNRNYKPGLPEPLEKRRKRRNCNSWYFANQSDICKQIWEIGQVYHNKMKQKETRPKNHNKFSVQLVKYFYFLYLTGTRRSEPFQKPGIEINEVYDEGRTFILVKRVNEKHFIKATGERDIIEAAIPIFDEWELKMWNFITDGGQTTNADLIFKFQDWKVNRMDKISKLIKTNFKTNLKDEAGKTIKDAGISPHILRHMRAYNILGEHRISPNLAIQYFGWEDQRMLFYYAHIRRMLSVKNQIQVIKQEGYGLQNIRLGLSITY